MYNVHPVERIPGLPRHSLIFQAGARVNNINYPPPYAEIAAPPQYPRKYLFHIGLARREKYDGGHAVDRYTGAAVAVRRQNHAGRLRDVLGRRIFDTANELAGRGEFGRGDVDICAVYRLE